MSSMTIVLFVCVLAFLLCGCAVSDGAFSDAQPGDTPASATPTKAAPANAAPATPAPRPAPASKQPERAPIDALLDRLHSAAATANADAYWSCYTDNAVFIGTDATERWTLTEFKEYAAPHFGSGKGWAYTPSNRHIDFSPDGRTAWFDETVTHAQYGACRGTGVVLLTPAGWKVAQYHLTLPIPNDLLPEEAEKIKKYLAEPIKK